MPLQWGRRLMATEIPQTAVDNDGAPMLLQWGRRLMATEMLSREVDRVLPPHASMGPSSDGDGNVVNAGLAMTIQPLQWGRRLMATEMDGHGLEVLERLQLQWGRRLMATEIILSAPWSRRPYRVASMGPSSDGDGNEVDIGLMYERAKPLQWGRRLMATEMGHSRLATTEVYLRFNGAVV